jgi:large subunit ribosomal protein L18
MSSKNIKQAARQKRKVSIRKRISGIEERPRLSVFRSTKHIYAQLIDDTRGLTLAAASSLEKLVEEQVKQSKDEKKKKHSAKVNVAFQVGRLVAQRAMEKGVRKVVFDRNGFLYHGPGGSVVDGRS